MLVGAEGHRLNYHTLGRGADTVVIVHGFQGTDAEYLAPDLLPLARDHTLLIYDQRGGGRSEGPPGPAHPGLLDHVHDLEALRQHFKLERLQLFGHAGGAAIVLQYAGTHPERVRRALLVAPPPVVGDGYAAETGRAFYSRLDSATWAHVQTLDAGLATAEAPAVLCRQISQVMLPRAFLADSTAFARMKGDFCSAQPERLRTQGERRNTFLQLQGRDWHSYLPKITSPVLVIHGKQDAIPVASAHALAEALPDARALELPRADHLPSLDQPGPFFAAAASFFQREWPAVAEQP